MALPDGLRELTIVDVDVAKESVLQIPSTLETMALRDVLDPGFEHFDHAVPLRPYCWSQTIIDAEVRAEQVELVLSDSSVLAQTEQAIVEAFSVLGQHRCVLHLFIGAARSKSRRKRRALTAGCACKDPAIAMKR